MRDRRNTATLLLLPLLFAGASGLAALPPAVDAPAAAATSAAPGTLATPATPAATATLVGTLVDTHCFSLDRSFAIDDHRTTDGTIEGCAQACASMGIPVALVTESGEALVLLVPAPDLADHMGREARVVGQRVLDGSFRPDSLFVRGDRDAWERLSLHKMM